MAIDTSMYSRMSLPDFFGAYQRGAEVKREREAREEQQRLKEAKGKVYQVGPGGKLSLSQEGLAEYSKLDPSGGYAMQRQYTRDQDADSKSKYESELREADFIARGLSGVKDQQGFDRFRSMAQSKGYDVSELGEQYSPETVSWARGKSLSYKDQIAKEASDRGYNLQRDQFEYQKEKDRADRKVKETKASSTPISKGVESADKEYGKEFVRYTSKGRTNAVNTIEKLKRLQMQVAEDTGFGEAGGGRLASFLPDAFRSRLAIERRDDARNFANKILKELFGGQLSDAEREAAAREFWNDSLNNRSNANRLAGKIKELEDNLRAQDAQAEYFQKFKTLDGFQFQPTEDQELMQQYSLQDQNRAYGIPGVGTVNAAPPPVDFNSMSNEQLEQWIKANGG